MSNFSAIKFPNQMRPELAKHIAETICWAPGDSGIVSFAALSLLFASWVADGPSSLEELTSVLRRIYQQQCPEVLKTLSDEEMYSGQALKHAVGPLTAYHASQAIKFWVANIEEKEVSQFLVIVEATFSAAVEDDSERAEAIAEGIERAVEGMSSSSADDNEDGFAAGGVMVSGPEGAVGPFSSVEEAKTYVTSVMMAQLQGQPPPPLPKMRNGRPTPVIEEKSEEAHDDASSMRVYSQADVISLVQRMPPPMPGEGNVQQRRMLESMANNDGRRLLTVAPEINLLGELYQRFPHFKGVLDFVTQRLALAACGDEGSPVRIPPILLRGVMGTGKSYFAKELARVLGTSYVERDLSVMTEAFVVTGTDATWKGSKPGIVFESLINGKSANPLICLNEIDKASGRGSSNSPIAALYTLLEPESSMNFTDEFIPVAIDASRIIWVCTANEGEIPAPILDRMEVFTIKEPTKAECRAIAISVWSSICSTVLPHGHGFSAALGEPLLEAISAMRPRIMRKALTHAAGEAAMAGNSFMTLENLAFSQKRYDDVPIRSIGFVQ